MFVCGDRLPDKKTDLCTARSMPIPIAGVNVMFDQFLVKFIIFAISIDVGKHLHNVSQCMFV